MANKTQTITRKYFDYNSLSSNETRAKLRGHAGQIKTLLKRSARDIYEIGSHLTQAKEVLGFGKFENWIDAEFGLSHDSANRFMNVYRVFQNTQIADFEALSPSILYALSSPSVTDRTRASALEKAASGELKTVADVKAHIESSKPAPPTSSDEFIATSTPRASPEPEPEEDPFADEVDDDEPDFSLPTAEPGTPDEFLHPFAEVDSGTEDEPEPRFAQEFLVGDEVAGTTTKGEYVLGVVTSISPDDADGRKTAFVKGENHGNCYTDQLTLAYGRYLGGSYEHGQLVAWEFEGQTTYGRFLEYSGDPERICVTDFFDPSKQYEPKVKALGVRRWTIEDRKNALAIRDAVPKSTEPEEDEQKEPTLEETLAALPLAQALALYKHNGVLFLQQANLWHQSQKVVKAVRAKLEAARFTKGPVTDWITSVKVVSEPPEKWEGCPRCKGSLRFKGDPCELCHSVGFTTRPGEGVTPDVVATHAAEFVRES